MHSILFIYKNKVNDYFNIIEKHNIIPGINILNFINETQNIFSNIISIYDVLDSFIDLDFTSIY